MEKINPINSYSREIETNPHYVTPVTVNAADYVAAKVSEETKNFAKSIKQFADDQSRHPLAVMQEVLFKHHKVGV